MSTFNRIVVACGLCVAFAGVMAQARGQAASDLPSPPESTQAEAARTPRERYLMLTNGRLIKGILSETPTECVIEQRVGIMHFPKKRVEGSFDSIREAYEYRLAQLPGRDSDERMKLALWCLNLNLSAEARELLSSILEQNPNHAQAKAMMLSIEQAATRLARRERDPDVRQTRADTMGDGRPEVLDSAVLRNAQRGLGITNLPEIFDLPLPLAIKRTEEFARYVHPILQAKCANCHDAQYEGQFQLVPIKSRGDRTSNALRANLDATLRLVEPSNLSHSVLLSSTLRPHGNGARPRPIFAGSNDKAYKVLAQWVNHLTAPKEGEGSARDLTKGSSENGEVFAVDRNRSAAAGSSKRAGTDARMSPAATPNRIATEPQEFPIPFAISGVMAKPALPKKATSAPAKQAASAATSKASPNKPKASPDTAGEDDDPDDLPELPKPKKKTGTKAQTAQPLKIDPKLLEQALQYRNANRPN